MLLNYLGDISREYPGSVEIRTLYPGSEAFAGVRDSGWTKLVESLSGQQAEVVNYATEAPYINKLGCQTLVLGPGSINQAHQPDEYLAMDQLKPTVELLKQLIYKACIQ
jgi:acetylornithine deacetylase